jgi:protein-S-isoprenylcysteine O-methyltransferase Ste14
MRYSLTYLPLCYLLTSCSSRENNVKGLGLFILILFVAFWAFSIFLPKIQESIIVQKAVQRVKKPINYIANILIVIFSVLAVVSTVYGEGLLVLFGAVFGIGIVGLHYLKKWTNSETSGNNKVELKIVVGSISFIITLIWLIFRGTTTLRL